MKHNPVILNPETRTAPRISMVSRICMVSRIGMVIVMILILAGCKSQKNPAERQSGATPEFSASSLAEASNYFALDLFRQIQSKSGNLVYSPYSISTVMAMCYSGAKGKTAEQMSGVLYFPASGRDGQAAGQLDPAGKDLKDRILSNDTLTGTEISLANAIWAQEDFDFLPEYIQNIQKWYDAPLTGMDFTRDDNREESRKRINRWVEEITREKIRDLIEPGVLDANTRMVLTNAMYFNGQWMWPFDKQLTSPSIFHVSSRESIMTDFMHLTKTLSFYEDEEIQAIKLPYRNERISMTIILPRSVEGWEMISRVLDHERLATVESQFESAEVHVSLPKFKSELMLNLKNELSAMGMSLAFSRDADLSGMSGEKNLFIDEVLHKAFIEVSENGTEAAAATAAVIGLKSALREEPARFNADHPFLYLIRDQQTGCIIFIGRLVKP